MLYSMKLHELIGEHLYTVSKCIHQRYSVPLPWFSEPDYFDENLDVLYQKIMNAPHVNQHMFQNLNSDIMTTIANQTKEIE